jgi:cyclic pyranopterin phosphate synthase
MLRKNGDYMSEFTHFDDSGNAVMVDVTQKAITKREAVACGVIELGKEAYEAVIGKKIKKGDVLGVARIAAIMACKETSHIIPLCHPLMLSKIAVDFEYIPDEYSIKAICTVGLSGQTGVEMEALHGVSVALLTIYDMCKAISKRMVMKDIHLMTKSGGKSGEFEF